MHLSDEQFEDVLQEAAPAGAKDHLAQCPDCRRKLSEHQAVRERLRRAFSAVRAPAALADRLRARAGQAAGTGAPAPPASRAPSRPARAFSPRWRIWPALAAAAAILVVALPLALYFAGPPSAQAAQQELIAIHRLNLADGHGFFSEDEPAKLAAYLKDKLGFVPALPKLNQGIAIRGCCVTHFRGQIVGSYVVNTPRGLISIIVVRDRPDALGMKTRLDRAGRAIWTGAFATNSLAAARMGEFTYCAVGEVPVDSLVDLLAELVLAGPS